MRTMQREIGKLWKANRALTAVGLGMLVVLVATLAGLVVDPRLVGGAPAWLKPAKFAISTAIYSLTLAWVFTQMVGWPRLKRIVGNVTAAVFVLEVALISLQAARGTTSHFNVATAFDASVFAVMGSAILVQWVGSIAVAVALFRQSFADRALGWALRLGLLIAVIGAAVGGVMTRPTEAQLAQAQVTTMTVSGAHTVGAPDGGPGLPGTGWSREHGDLRVAHFLGLHAFQVLPLFAWLLGGVSSRKRERAVLVAAASYASLFVILLAQALAGQSVLATEGPTGVALIAWAVATVLLLSMVAFPSRLARTSVSTNVMVS